MARMAETAGGSKPIKEGGKRGVKLPPMLEHATRTYTPPPTPSVDTETLRPSSPTPALPAGWDALLSSPETKDRFAPTSPSQREEEPEQEKVPQPRRVYEMTWDQYNALKPQQRAAIDWNTLLVRAREKDRKLDYENEALDGGVSPKEMERYTETMGEMFGPDKGSDIYAPETLALLEKMEYKSTGTDFDEFLNLQAAVGDKFLKQIEKAPTPVLYSTGNVGERSNVLEDRLPDYQELAEKTRVLLSNMSTSQQLTNDPYSTVSMTVNPGLRQLGGVPNELTNVQRGFPGAADAQEVERFHVIYGAMQRFGELDESMLALAIDEMNKELGTPDKKQAFVEFVQAKAAQEELLSPGSKKQQMMRDTALQALGLAKLGG